MILLRIRLIVILATILAASTGLAVQAQQPAPADENAEETKTGAIAGTVVNDNGQPLAGAFVFVSVVGSPTLGRSTITDSDGNFHVRGLDPALYYVSARIPAYIAPPLDPDEPQQATYYRVGESVRLVQTKGGVITGTVANSSGEPVVGLSVRASMIRDVNGQVPKLGVGRLGDRTTDDRGIYRIYGLVPGTYVVSTGGLGNRFSSFSANAYDTDAPTYAPSSTRDTAAEFNVRAGDETSGVDIRYRGEPGRVISGTANGAFNPNSFTAFNITLTTILNGAAQWVSSSFQSPGSRGFSFLGVVDGDYVLSAQSALVGGEITMSEPRPIKVRGADVTSIELTTKPLPSIAGRLKLEASKAPECQGKRRPLFAETLITATRQEKSSPIEFAGFFSTTAAPDKEGLFTLRNVQPGQYIFNPQFFARYWYLQSISLPPNAKTAGAAQPVDGTKNWTTVKLGDRVGQLAVVLAEGAASLRGQLTTPEGQKLPPKLIIYLVPAEREKADDVLRFFVAVVTGEGNFVFSNLAPGRYWLLVRPLSEIAAATDFKLRLPDQATARANLRRESEAAKTELELKPCQNVTAYKLPLKLSTATVINNTHAAGRFLSGPLP